MSRTAVLKVIRFFATVFVSLAIGAVVSAQTVRPVISELGNPGKGRIEYVNDSLTPLNIVLEAKSFTVTEQGEINYRPLDPDVHLKLSATSFRVQPKQTFYVFYEASAPARPTWFVIYASFSGFPFRTAQGMNVRLQLPHTVYLLPRQRTGKADVRVLRAEFDTSTNKVLLEVENTGDNFGRVLQTQLSSGRKKQDAPGFPIFPHSKRILEVPLDAQTERDSIPTDLSLQFENFKIEEKLRIKPNNDIQLASASTSSTAVPGDTGEKR